jgi:polyhydroxybutyrate depolymerase
MDKLRQKFVSIRNEKRSRKIFLIIIVFCVVMIALSFSPDFSPLFHGNIISVITSIRNNFNNTTPVSNFNNNAPQDPTAIIDRPIQSTGCGEPLTIKTGESTYMEITSSNTKRRFIVYLPKEYQNTSQHSLILAFHGYASNPFSMEKFTHFDQVADNNNIVVVYPEGTTSVVGLRGWNTGLHPTIKANDVLFVSNMLNTLQSNLCINPDQIYATGFSDGGGFVAELSCQFSNRIAAVAPASGSYVTAFKTCRALRPLPVIEFHGTKDPIVPYLGLESKKEFAALTWVGRWAKRDGCTPYPVVTNETEKITKYMWIDCKDNASVIHYKIKGEGHSWPHMLFDERQNNKIIKVNSANIIWNFFSKHPLPKNVQQSPETSST